MFGTTSVSSEYTFTGSQASTISIESAISSYSGHSGATKTSSSGHGTAKTSAPQQNVQTGSNSNSVATNSITKEKSADSESVELLINKGGDDDSLEIDYGSDDISTITTSFQALAAAVGSKNSKGQLVALLRSLTSQDATANADEITFLKTLLATFDTLSNGGDYITSFGGANDTQDYETVTLEQVTPPIDIRI